MKTILHGLYGTALSAAVLISSSAAGVVNGDFASNTLGSDSSLNHLDANAGWIQTNAAQLPYWSLSTGKAVRDVTQGSNAERGIGQIWTDSAAADNGTRLRSVVDPERLIH